jgi:hypothetical protein
MSAVCLALLWRTRNRYFWARLWIAFSLSILLLAAFFASIPSMWLWDRLPLLQYLEFPWRTLSLVAMSTAILCGASLTFVTDRPRLANRLMIALIVLLALLSLPHARPVDFYEVRDANYTPEAIAASNLSVTTAREYEPIWVQERPPDPVSEPVTLLTGQARVLSARSSPTAFEIDAQVSKAARLRVNVFAYPGWTLIVDGVERPIVTGTPQGTIEFELERGEHWVQVIFRDTPVRRWSARLSALAMLLIATWWLFAPMLARLLSHREHREHEQTMEGPL